MASLHDQSFNREAWTKLALVVGAAAIALLLLFVSLEAHERLIEVPRLLDERHSEPVGTPGRVTTQITRLGAPAVETLARDVRDAARSTAERRKSIELVSGIDDPRVLPLLAEALASPDLGVKLAAIAGIVRHGKPEGAALLWKALEGGDDWLRQRLIVALGLVARGADIEKLIERTKAAKGGEQVLLAWAAGQAMRRKTDLDQIGRLPPAKLPHDDEDERRIQAEVDLTIGQIQAGDAVADNALKLARLTAIEFGTWDQAHQISYQTIAVRGPMALRGTARIDALPAPVRRKAAATPLPPPEPALAPPPPTPPTPPPAAPGAAGPTEGR